MIAGVVLAGGRSTRMGHDKAMVTLAGITLIERAIERLTPQCGAVAVNSNLALEAVEAQGVPLIADAMPGFQGPLAGMLAALDWATSAGATHVATVPVDTPFFPSDFVARLAGAAGPDQIAVARSQARLHPTCALLPATSAAPLRTFLDTRQSRRVMDFLDLMGFCAIDFDTSGDDPFFNVNRPEDLAVAEERVRSEP
ncbi:MAG: molybdenum cofactor guanylyltransferase MobA [Mesorhizobium sp.]